jgi:hypothetical protein
MKSTETNNSGGRDVAQENGRNETKKPWEPMKLTYAGEAKDIVRSGGGKVGITQADQGDTNKPKGQT